MDAIRKSIFKINVVTQQPRFGHPWLHSNQSASSGTGFYIGQNRILTNAHVVANARYITIQRDGDDRPLIATIKFIAHDSDLAILEPEDTKSLANTRPLSIGGLPKLRKPVATIGYPMGGEQISITEGVVSRISYRRYAHTRYHRHLLVQVDSAINPGNSGGPVVQGDYVVGVAFQAYDEAENTGYIIPPPVINRFLKDIADGTYDGHPDSGLVVMEGVGDNPAIRSYHKIPDNQTGVKVAYVLPYAAIAEHLKTGDIIQKVNQYDIGQDGKILYQGERVNFKTIYDLSQIGDTTKFVIIRAGDKKTITVTTKPSTPHHSQANLYPRFPRYLIYSGLVFSSLSRNYLKVWGNKWYQDAPLKLRYLHWYWPWEKAFANRRELIVLSSRLPHPVNEEANGAEEGIIETVNGKAVKDLEELDQALSAADSKFITLGLWGQPTPVVLVREHAKQAHGEILERYGIYPERWLGGNSTPQVPQSGAKE